MDNSTCGDVTQRQVVAGLDICLCTCLNNISLPHTLRGNDIALLAICIMQERDAGRPVRIIFDLSNFCWYAIFIPPLEINKAVLALVRPPVLLSLRSRDFSGVERVISEKSDTEALRRPGVVGLY